jgi:hypothetical protein
MTNQTEIIEQVMDELEDTGMVSSPDNNDRYDMLREVRSYMGEFEFYKFLEYSMRVWGFEQAKHFEN